MTLRKSIVLLVLALFPALAFSAADRMANPSTGAPGGQDGGNKDGEIKTVNDMKGGQPIVEPFKKYFDKCAVKGINGGSASGGAAGGASGSNGDVGKCKFKDMGIDRELHKGKPSCHHKGEAIDVGLVNCGGGDIDPQKQQDSYMEIAKCMATETDDTFKVIYRDQTPVANMMPGRDKGKHEDHMHIQLKSCSLSGMGKGGAQTAARGR